MISILCTYFITCSCMQLDAFRWILDSQLPPAAKSLALAVPSIFTSKIMWHGTNSWNGGRFSSLSKILNAIRIFFIYLVIASFHRVLWCFLSNLYASFAELGNTCSYLEFFFISLCCNFEIIWSHFLKTWSIHHLKAGDWTRSIVEEYWVVSMGYDSFKSFNCIQVNVPSFQEYFNSWPLVVMLPWMVA